MLYLTNDESNELFEYWNLVVNLVVKDVCVDNGCI